MVTSAPMSPSRWPASRGRSWRTAAAVSLAILAAPGALLAADEDLVLRVALDRTSSDFSLDPALAKSPAAWTILANTNRGLMAFKRASGQAGSQLVPDLADRAPEYSRDGTRLTFHLRDDVKFASADPKVNGRPVTPKDVKASIERMLLMDSPGKERYFVIRGAEQVNRDARGAAGGIHIDNDRGTISFDLLQADPTFEEALALPWASVLPADTPTYDQSTSNPASAGPFYVARYRPGSAIELRLNSDYRSPDPALPDPTFQQVDVEIGVSPNAAVSGIAGGDFDVTLASLDKNQVDAAKKRYTRNINISDSTQPSTYYFFMNVKSKPFGNEHVRAAVNLAIDRGEIEKLFGGRAKATYDLIPNVLPGGQAAKAATTTVATKANLLAAAKEIAAAKLDKAALAQRITIWGYNIDPSPAVTQYLKTVLTELKFTNVTVKLLDKSRFESQLKGGKTSAQIGYYRWSAEIPDPSGMFNALKSVGPAGRVGSLNFSNFSTDAVDKQIQAVRQLKVGTPQRALALQNLAKTVKADQPWVPFANDSRSDVFSARIAPGSFVYQPILGPIWTRLKPAR